MLIRKCGDSNATPLVIRALSQLQNGGTLLFEQGEYHFYEEGARHVFLAPSNNSTGYKNIVFPIFGCRDLVIDGGGSTFVFHDLAFPFVIKDSRNITVKNITVTTRFPSFVVAEATDIDENGFSLKIDRALSPFHTENGHLIFELEHCAVSTQDRKLSLHSLSNLWVRYLYAGDCSESKENLAAPFFDTDARETENGVRFTYRNTQGSAKCDYVEGQKIAVNLEERRERDVLFSEDSSELLIQNFTVRRGGGMGIIAQMCRDITVDGFHAEPILGEAVSLTADVFHFVQCGGKLILENSTLCSSLDDACNIHGNYMEVERHNNREIRARYGHKDHDHSFYCRVGDVLEVIDPDTLDIVGKITVEDIAFSDSDGLHLRLISKETPDFTLRSGMLLENAARMPDVTIRNNHWYNFPHVRLSGAGETVVEKNYFHDCGCAVMAYDLTGYWFESGRMRSLCIRDNLFGPCRSACVIGGVSGYEGENTPEIHDTIRIENNTFTTENGGKVLCVYGFKHVIVHENTENGKPFSAL